MTRLQGTPEHQRVGFSECADLDELFQSLHAIKSTQSLKLGLAFRFVLPAFLPYNCSAIVVMMLIFC